ncbi:MAG: helix-turn-helix transcriptional regulator [Acidobacteriaceae bacterium]|nr:helix-turn-helix transcriptional regulator [Acidobacteriaceae bacterium]
MAMNFQDLRELLRVELLRRMKEGTLTGSRLAGQTGFQQAHISNFLHRKRSLSLEGLDRVLDAQGLSIDQLIPMEMEGSAAASSAAAEQDSMESVPVVSASTAMNDARIRAAAWIESVCVSASWLHNCRPRQTAKVAEWQRFVAVRADQQQVAAMAPVVTEGAVVVIDRHYNSLAPYRQQQPTLYAVRYGTTLQLRYVDFNEGKLILRPHSREFPVQLLSVKADESPSRYITGRVCMVMAEC